MKGISLFLILHFFCFFGCGIHNEKKVTKLSYCSVTLFISPKNVDYGWMDNGIYKFNLSKRHVIVSYEERSYNVKTVQDKIHEFYFTDTSINFDSLDLTSPIEESKNANFLVPRILIVSNSCKQDTLKIDSNWLVKYDNRLYHCNEYLKRILYYNMPSDLFENWKYNIGIGELNDLSIPRIIED